MNNTPLITVIIATYNADYTLQRCIDSVVAQTYPYRELIIMDGDSTDGTVDILKANEGRISYWESEPDRGIYHAWNKALAHTNGDWICFLGADDYLMENEVLVKLLPYLKQAEDSGIRVVYGSIAKIDNRGNVIKYVGKPWSKIKSQMLHGMPLPHPGLLHHKNLFKEHGKFDETFQISGDYELLLRELKSGDAVYAAKICTAAHQGGGISNTSSLLALKEVAKARYKNNIHVFPWIWILVYCRVVVRRLWRKFFPSTAS